MSGIYTGSIQRDPQVLAQGLVNPSAIAQTQLGLAVDAQRDYNASGLNTVFSGTMAAGDTQCTLNTPWDGQIGQGVFLQHAGAVCGCLPPAGFTASMVGATGTTTINYAVVSLDGHGGVSAAATLSVTNATGTLSVNNYVSVSWTPPSSGTTPTGYLLLAQVGGGPWQLANWDSQGVTSWNDTGLYYPLPSYLPSVPPANPTSDYLITTVTAITGNTITLADPAISAITNDTVLHDDTAALNTFLTNLAQGKAVGVIPPGDYNVSGQGAVLQNSTTNRIDIFGYGARIHIQPGTQANGFAIIDSRVVRLYGLTVYGNYPNVDASGGQYTSVCPILIGSFTEGTGGCTDVKIFDCEMTQGYFGGIVFNTSQEVDIINCFAYDNRDNAFFGRPHNNGVRVINPRATGSVYNGIEFIHSANITVVDAEAWDNGPSPYSTEGAQIGFEGCTDFAINGAYLYQVNANRTSQGVKCDYTVEGGSTLECQNGVLSNIRVNGISEKTCPNGLVIDGYGIYILRSNTIKVDSCHVANCYLGVNLPNDSTYPLSNIRFENVTVSGSTADGCDITATNGSGEAVFVACAFDNNGQNGANNGCYLAAWNDFEFTDCRFVGNQGEGLHVSAGTNHKIMGGLVKDNTDNGILVTGSTGEITVRGMEATNTTAGSLQGRLLYEGTSTSTTHIIDCVIDGQANEPYYLANAGSYALGNTFGVKSSPAVLSGTNAGEILWQMPEQGSGYKKFVAYLNGYENTGTTAQTLTFPTAFNHTPTVSQPNGFGATVSTTTLTLPTGMTGVVSGVLVVEGI